MILPLLLAFVLAAPPRLQIPLILTIRQTIGMAPFTLRLKVRAEAEGREVCVVVDRENFYRRVCQTLDGITWTQDFLLRDSGDYSVFAYTDRYKTPELTVRVIGLGGEPED